MGPDAEESMRTQSGISPPRGKSGRRSPLLVLSCELLVGRINYRLAGEADASIQDDHLLESGRRTVYRRIPLTSRLRQQRNALQGIPRQLQKHHPTIDVYRK